MAPARSPLKKVLFPSQSRSEQRLPRFPLTTLIGIRFPMSSSMLAVPCLTPLRMIDVFDDTLPTFGLPFPPRAELLNQVGPRCGSPSQA